ALLGREKRARDEPAQRAGEAMPDVRRDLARMDRVDGDTRALEPARQLLREQDVRELGHRVLAQARDARALAQRVPVELLREVVRVARDVDDARTGGLCDPVEQQA